VLAYCCYEGDVVYKYQLLEQIDTIIKRAKNWGQHEKLIEGMQVIRDTVYNSQQELLENPKTEGANNAS